MRQPEEQRKPFKVSKLEHFWPFRSQAVKSIEGLKCPFGLPFERKYLGSRVWFENA